MQRARRRTIASLLALAGFAAAPLGPLRAAAPRVLVIGAGMSGIAAARRLRREGCDVQVVEARDRIGGRIHSSRALGATIDLGAAWIHGHRGNPLVAMAAEAGVRTLATDWDAVRLYTHQGNPVAERDLAVAWDVVEAVEARIALAQASARPADSVAPVIERARNEVFSALPAGQRRIVEWLLRSGNDNESGAGFDGRGLRAYDSESAFEGDDLLLREGYLALLEPMAEGLSIQLGSPVKAVSHHARGVQVYLQSGVAMQADAAIVTTPLGVLKSGGLQFEPALPAAQGTAIRRLRMGVLNKLVLRFPQRFWEAGLGVFGMIGEAEDGSPSFECLALDDLTGLPILLMLYGAARGIEFEQRGRDIAVAEVVARLRRQYTRVAAPDAVLHTGWFADPWSRGSYSVMAPGASLDDHAVLGEAAGPRLWLAGEATVDDFPATVHGAYRSGLRAADAVLEELG
jgi:polyamine oxidase